MSIKSVREINYFQTLRDREINISFCNLNRDKTAEDLRTFVTYLVNTAKDELEKNDANQLTHMEKDCITALHSKFQDKTEEINLTFLETVHLHSILDYFESNYNKFEEHTKNKSVPHQLTPFVLFPANYYNALFRLKNKIEYKLGELVANSYKFKYK